MAQRHARRVAKLRQDQLTSRGSFENIVTVNRMFELLPFDGIRGRDRLQPRARSGQRRSGRHRGGDRRRREPDRRLDDRNPGPSRISPRVSRPSSATPRSRADPGDPIEHPEQKATQVASKAKHCGRVFQHMLINGWAGDQFTGLALLCASGRRSTPGPTARPSTSRPSTSSSTS